MKKIVLLIALITFNIIANAQSKADDVVGTWKTGSGNAKVQIYKTTSGHYAGKIVWLEVPIDPDTKLPKLDKRNSSDELKTKPLMGLINIYGFKFDEGDKEWQGGKVYDPKNGKTYSSKMSMPNYNTLNVRGYIGISLLGRTDVWIRQ